MRNGCTDVGEFNFRERHSDTPLVSACVPSCSFKPQLIVLLVGRSDSE